MNTFIIDTNIVFSALAKDGLIRHILIDSPFNFYAPETLITEIRKYESLILEKSGLRKEDFEILFNIIQGSINLVEKRSYEEYFDKAKEGIGSVDNKDVPFLALALSIKNDGIWSDDDHFTKQSMIKIWKTKDVVSFIKSEDTID